MRKLKTMRVCAVAFGGAAALLGGCASTDMDDAAASATMDPSCPPDGALNYICDVINAEDILQVGASEWLIASNMNNLGAPPGPSSLYLINSERKTVEQLFPGSSPSFMHDAAMYPNCPGPVNLEAFSTHGLALREKSQDVYRLYVTSHGEREAVEAFELDARGDKPVVSWVGCVPINEPSFTNSVAILADGGFVTTRFMDPSDPQAFAKLSAGEISGGVYEWRPGHPVTTLPGTELAGPNGIVLSADERWMFVAAFGAHEVVRFDREASPMTKTSVSVGSISPDNLRWAEDGSILTAGVTSDAPGWAVYAIDPSAMEATELLKVDGDAALQGTATALQVGGEIWFGTYSGDRVGYITIE